MHSVRMHVSVCVFVFVWAHMYVWESKVDIGIFFDCFLCIKA